MHLRRKMGVLKKRPPWEPFKKEVSFFLLKFEIQSPLTV